MSKKLIPTAKIEEERAEDGSLLRFTVWTTWSGGDLPHPTRGYGMSCATKRPLAERLVRAIEAGVVYTTPVIKKNIYGEPFIHHEIKVRGRCLNADLKRLGF